MPPAPKALSSPTARSWGTHREQLLLEASPRNMSTLKAPTPLILLPIN